MDDFNIDNMSEVDYMSEDVLETAADDLVLIASQIEHVISDLPPVKGYKCKSCGLFHRDNQKVFEAERSLKAAITRIEKAVKLLEEGNV